MCPTPAVEQHRTATDRANAGDAAQQLLALSPHRLARSVVSRSSSSAASRVLSQVIWAWMSVCSRGRALPRRFCSAVRIATCCRRRASSAGVHRPGRLARPRSDAPPLQNGPTRAPWPIVRRFTSGNQGRAERLDGSAHTTSPDGMRCCASVSRLMMTSPVAESQPSQCKGPLTLLQSHRRLDVLVELEQIRWVVFILQGNQPLVFLGAIGGQDPLSALVGLLPQIVDVHAAGQAWLHGFPELTRPPHAALSLGRVGAHTEAQEAVLHVPVVERGGLTLDTAHRAT